MRLMQQNNHPEPDARAAADADTRQDEVMIAYLPIVRGAAIAVLGYFLFDLVSRIFFPGDAYHGVMLAAVATGALCSVGMIYALRTTKDVWHLEVVASVICLSLFINSNLQQSLYFEVENLLYSVLMMPIFAAILPTRRTILTGIVLSFASLVWLVQTNMPEQVADYFWVGVSGVAAGVAISEIIRTAVLNSVKARLAAVRDREKAEDLARETRHLAECDALTGLPNRRSFFLALNHHVEHLRKTGDAFFLGLVDLDGFKPVNDTYGHAAGDEMLRAVARRLEDAGGATAFPARLGGDEFAILAPAKPKSAEAILTLGHRIEARLSEPYDLGDYTCEGSGSVGLLICDNPELSAHDLMERADHALYFAKRSLQGRAVLFNAALEREMMTSSQVDKALRKSDHDKEFSLVFQPQFDLTKSRITGFEALARWESPELGPVAPDVFISAAERAGLIRPLTRVLLTKALTAMAEWPSGTKLSFNLSTHDLMSPNAIEAILATVRDSGIPASRIEFEITETAMMSDFNQARRAIDQINRAGHSVALDDFGIGYSSLQYLQQLPVSKLKIDHSFVSSILEDSSSYKIVRTLLSLSQTLDLGCVIEGVETEAQLHILRTMGARHIQGYLIGQPMPEDQIRDVLQRRFDFSPRALSRPQDNSARAARS
ncbi:putative bifunctional diguanylate cyclase/phosphodiesterase [Maricaulis parjimensis]|uniref:putative bifunctional diguanylate cyclase/phosphodiesterase n=1 Tax=Maricaulis parjimensis TaxID=144023 RepID=UPI00193936C3|nr:EAL domain-containing protein [Maricaulis parjimensis]